MLVLAVAPVAAALAPHVAATIGGFSQPCGITSSATSLYADSYGDGRARAHRPGDERVVAEAQSRDGAMRPRRRRRRAVGRGLQVEHDRRASIQRH